MSAFRFSLGPIPSALGPVFQLIEISPDGRLIRAAGTTVAEALQRLNARPNVSETWLATQRLVDLDAGSNSQAGAPTTTQFAAAIRHILPLMDPASQFDCAPDEIVHALFGAFAMLWFQGSGLRPGTSRPFEFDMSGLVSTPGYTVFSAAQDSMTCVAMGEKADLRALYEAGFTARPQAVALNLAGFTLGAGPEWVLDIMEDLTGQRFCAEVFMRLNGEADVFGEVTSQICAILAASWPINPEHTDPQEAFYTLPDGSGRILLTPLTL
ncbi:MAG: hypothetical protein ABJL99_03365 [Aliishimia sp.]